MKSVVIYISTKQGPRATYQYGCQAYNNTDSLKKHFSLNNALLQLKSTGI